MSLSLIVFLPYNICLIEKRGTAKQVTNSDVDQMYKYNTISLEQKNQELNPKQREKKQEPIGRDGRR